MTQPTQASANSPHNKAGTGAEPCQVAVIGLGVMGSSLALNMADHAYRVAVFDTNSAKVQSTLKQSPSQTSNGSLTACHSNKELLASLTSPRIIILSVPAGVLLDRICESLLTDGLNAEDIVIDTGNSLWTDSVRRADHFQGRFQFFITAVSGGEVGARFGPSLMASGSKETWQQVKPILNSIAAKVDEDTGKALENYQPGKPILGGTPCAGYVGPNGAGHFVKMVHNGIEYADMQLICESYHLMRDGWDMLPREIAVVFQQWNAGPLESYLIEISADILDTLDPESKKPLVDLISDKAGQKGTGLWTAVNSLELGCPTPTIAEAVYARTLSSLKAERVEASSILNGPKKINLTVQSRNMLISQLHDALYCAKICVYAQGFQLMKQASDEQQWALSFSDIAKLWRGGCIIRAGLLRPIADAFQRNEELPNLLTDPYFSTHLNTHQNNWRQSLSGATLTGIPIPAFSSALAYFDGYRCATLPANLLQAQRDFFGAHKFERIDRAAGEKYHVDWATPPRTIKLVSAT